METLKRLAIIFAVAIIAACSASDAQTISGGVGVHNHSSAAQGGTLGLSTTLSSTKACASGYTRIGPNQCLIDAAGGGTALTYGACTAITNPSSDGRAIIIRVRFTVFSANAAGGVRETDFTAWDDNACAVNVTDIRIFQLVEQAAVPTVGTLWQTAEFATIKPTSVGGNPSVRVDVISGTAGGTAQYKIVGYYD